MNENAWQCPQCGRLNSPARTTCNRCQGIEQSALNAVDSIPSLLEFSIGPTRIILLLCMLAVVAFISWYPIHALFELTRNDPSSGIVVFVFLVPIGVLSIGGKWAISNLLTFLLFSVDFPKVARTIVSKRYASTSLKGTGLEFVTYILLFFSGIDVFLWFVASGLITVVGVFRMLDTYRDK